MTEISSPQSETSSRGTLAGWFFAMVTGFVLIAHGCHGPDEDHEPSGLPTMHQTESR